MNCMQILKKGRIFCLFFVLISVSSCTKDQEIIPQQISGNALGTTYHISYIGNEIKHIEVAIDSIIDAINHGLSTYQHNSLISCFNSNNTSLWEDSNEYRYYESDLKHFTFMVNLSKQISVSTDGAFDPSSACLFEEYNRAKKNQIKMDDQIIQSCLGHQGLDKIRYDSVGYPIKSDSLMQLNFNAIAKGYLVDVLGVYFDHKKIENYLIEVGGEMIAKGENGSGLPWTVGITTPIPNADPTQFFHVLPLKNKAIATSGNYQNFYKIDGLVVGHTMDPRSGRPVMTNLRSASIFHKSCAVADAYATACMTLGLEESIALIKQDTSLSAYFIFEKEHELMGQFVE